MQSMPISAPEKQTQAIDFHCWHCYGETCDSSQHMVCESAKGGRDKIDFQKGTCLRSQRQTHWLSQSPTSVKI